MKEIKNQENEKSITCGAQKAGEYDTDFDEKLSEQPKKNSAKTPADNEEVAKKAKKTKKKINWKHFLCYLCTYILVAAVVGFVIVKITPPAKSPTNYAGSINNTDDAGDDSILGQMVTNLMTMTDANLTLNLSAQTDEQRVAISAEIGAVIYPEFSGADASIKGDVWVNGKEFPFEFAYKGGVIFANVAGAQVQIKTDKLIDGIKLILSLAGVNMGLSNGIAESLDPMALMAIVQENLTEEEVEGGFKLTYKIDDATAAKVLIDENYNIKSVTLNDFTAGGATINLGLVFDKINSKYAVSAPAGEYLDVSETFGIVEALINSVKEKQVEATFDFGGVSAKLNLDRAGELKTRADLSFAGKNIVLTETERRTYISSEYANLSFDNFSHESVKEIMAAVLGLVESETGFDKASIPQSFEDIKAFAGEFDFNAIIKFLGAFKISAITKTNTGFEIKTNLFNLILAVENEKVSSVRVKDGEFDFTLNLAYGKAVDINEDDFEYVGDINGLKAPIVNLLKDKNLKNNYQNILNAIKTVSASTGLNRADVEARVEFGEFAFDVNLVIVKGDALSVAFETEFKGERIWGYIKDGAVYINALDVCLKVNLRDVLSDELDKLDDLKNFDASEIEEKIKAFDIAAFIRDFDISKYLEKFSLSLNENELMFVGFGVSARVDLTQNTLSNIAISGEIDSVKFSANLVLSETDTDIEMTNNEIVETGLTRGSINRIIDLVTAKIEGGEVDNAKALSQIIINTSKQTNFGVSGAFNGLGFALDFDIQNGIKARVNLNIDGQTVAVMVIGDTVYIESEYVCVKFNMLSKENLKRIYVSVMALIESETGKKIDIEAIKQNAQNVKLADVLRRVFGALPDILSELESAHITRTGDVFKLTCSLGTLTIETDGTLVTKISVESEKINQALSINYGNEISVDEAKFVNLGDSNEMADALVGVLESDNLKPTIENILSLVEKIKASLDTNCIDARVTTSLMGETIALDVRVVLRDELFVSFETEFKGVNIYGFVAGKTLYINIFDVCLKLDLTEIAGSEINKLDGAFNLDKREVLNKLKALDLNEIISKINIKEILSKLKLNLTSNLLSTSFNGLDIVVDLSGERIKNLTCAGSVNGIEFNAEVTLSRFDGTCDMNNLRVIELKNVKEIAEAAINSLKNKSVSGRADINFDFGGETNLISAEYGAKFDGEIKGYIKAQFKGLNVNIYYVNNTIYCDVLGLKIKLMISEIPELFNWINNKFNTNLKADKLFDDFDIKDISFNFLTNVAFDNSAIKARLFDKIDIVAEYSLTFNKVKFNGDGFGGVLYCTDFNDFNLVELNGKDYINYFELTDMVDAVYKTIQMRQFNINAKTKVFRNNAVYNDIDLNLIINILNKSGLNVFEVNGAAQVSGATNLGLNVAYVNQMLFVDYNGLKVSINKNSIKEILGIVLTVLNIDTTNIPLLNNLKTELDIDTDNLAQILPTLGAINPFAYLEYIKGINVNGNTIEIILNGNKINGNANFNPIVRLEMVNGSLSSIKIEKLYTGVTSDENISIDINFNTYNGLTKPNASEYIDISNSSDIIRAFVNTSALNDFHISGNVVLNLALGSLKIDAAKLDVDIKVKIDNNRRPIIKANISKYPLIGLVNNKNTNGAGATGFGLINQRYRSISIYYADGQIYIQTSDEKWGAYKQLDRVTKVTPTYLFDNIGYYMQWILGFTDSIQTKINDAIEISNKNKQNAASQGKLDYSNIILNYVKNGATHSFDVNIGKLAYNNDLGTLHVDLTTINNANTFNKDYIGALNFNLDLLDGLINLKTSSDNCLNLVNIGSKVDVIDAISAINNSQFQLDGEYEKTGSGDWKIANKGDRTVTLFDDQTQVGSLTGSVGTAIVLPTYDNRIIDDGVTRKEYRFVGWFMADGTKYVSSGYPRYDTDLYARWELIADEEYHTLMFETNEDILINNIKCLTGKAIGLPILQNIEIVIDENTSILKVFKGWFKDKNLTELCELESMPNEDMTLFAKWEVIETKTYNVKIFSAGKEVYNGKVQAGVEFKFPLNNYFNSETIYYYDAEFNTEVTSFVIESDVVWYARNKYNYTLTSQYTSLNGDIFENTVYTYEKTELTLPNYQNFEEDHSIYTTKYKFLGWRLDGTQEIISSTVMTAAGDATYTAVWEVKDYCIVSFNVDWAKPSNWKDRNNKTRGKIERIGDAPAAIASIEVEKGSQLDISKFNTSVVYKYTYISIPKTYSFFVGTWNTTGATCAFATTPNDVYSYTELTTVTIDSNITYYPTWDAK